MTSTDKYPIREIFQTFYPAYLKDHPNLENNKQRAAQCIMKCKTGELGYNASFCEECGNLVLHAVSCNNRSCPCCQHPQEKRWEMSRNTELIEGISYYHVVFTVPHALNGLIELNPALLLNLMFRCVQETLTTLCADRKYMGAKPGILSVMHTWGQKLNFHPHIHVCISGGGLTSDGKFRETRHKGFFIPEAVLAASFRGRYLCALKKLKEREALILPDSLKDPKQWHEFMENLFNLRWLPFVKETFNGKGNAIKYLARYSYRTAIANSRIISIDKDHVIFSYRDYKDDHRQKTLTVKGTDFIELFLQHVLPRGFNRTRFAGYLTNCQKTKNLKLIHRLRNSIYYGDPFRVMKTADLMKNIFNIDICKCPLCSAMMHRLPRGMPYSFMPSPPNTTLLPVMS